MKTQFRQISFRFIIGLFVLGIVFAARQSAAAAPSAALSVVTVGAPAINCVFDTDCTITVDDSSSPIVLPLATGEGALQTRTFPMGEAGTQAEDLFAYLYRVDLRNVEATSGVTPCVNWVRLDFGEIEQLDYDGITGVEDVFVITSGGIGTVSPTSVDATDGVVQINFGSGVCAGDSSHFVGITSSMPNQPVKANLFGWNDGPTLNVDVAARAPQTLGETVTLYPIYDTWVNTTPGASTPNPASQLLWIGSDEFTYESYALLQYDTSVIPAGAEVISAEIDLFHEPSAGSSSLTHNLCVHNVLSYWDENVDAASAPARDQICLAATDVATDAGSHIWQPLTSLVESWVTTPAYNYGLAIQQSQYNFGYKAFQSNEGNVKPALRVTYVADTQLDQAVDQLMSNSTGDTVITYEGTLPHHVVTEFDVSGFDANPVAQAQIFVSQFNGLYNMPDPISGLYLDRLTQTEGAGRSTGESNIFFKQRVYDVPVFGATFAVHTEDGKLTSTTGRYLQEFPQFPQPKWTAYEAEQYVIDKFGYEIVGETQLTLFNWSLLGREDDTTYQTWQVQVADPFYSGSVFVDAQLLDTVAFISDSNDARPGQDFTISDHSGRRFGDCSTGLEWFDEDGPTGYPGAASDSGADGSTANTTLHATYEFFFDNFGRRSWNNRSEQLPVRIDAVTTVGPNAQFNTRCGHMVFSENMVTLDIMAHEFAHGLDERTAQLIYQDQSGALDESFADVFGVLIDSDDWQVGEGSMLGAIRDVSNPPAFGHPDHMDNYLVTTSDFGGVHTNSGIPNKAAYLIIQGDTHNGITVDGLGRTKAQRLYYDVLTNRLTSNAQFIDARNAMIDQALSYVRSGSFGFTTSDACAVRDAWASVGIGSATDLRCAGGGSADSDGDGIPNNRDNCLLVANTGQEDTDADGVGNACDSDDDGDDVPDTMDNCRLVVNPSQADRDFDGIGDACDDSDFDRINDDVDNCWEDYNPDQADNDGTGGGDACDTDDDNDGVPDTTDNCQFTYNPGQADADGDGLGDACDTCASDYDPFNRDNDGDGIGDVCDPDDDNDGILDGPDNCDFTPNEYQFDLDNDGEGSLCDFDESLTLWEIPQHIEFLFPDTDTPMRIPLPRPDCDSCPNDWYIQQPDHLIQVDLPVGMPVRVVDNFGRTQAHVGARGNFSFSLPVDPEAGFELPFGPQRSGSYAISDLQYFLEIVPPAGYDISQPVDMDMQINQSVPTAVALSNVGADADLSQAWLPLLLTVILTVAATYVVKRTD